MMYILIEHLVFPKFYHGNQFKAGDIILNDSWLTCVDGSIPFGIESLSLLIHSVVSFPFFHIQTHSSGQSAACTAANRINATTRCTAFRMMIVDVSKKQTTTSKEINNR